MSLPKEGSREVHEGIIVAEPMDWCKSPTAIVPYKIWARQLQAADLADTVRQTDDRSHVKGSLVLTSHGDEPGVGGGVISGTRGAECTPKTWSATVRAEGRNMVRHDDQWWMNHKNTYGRLAYVKDPNTYDTPEAKQVEPTMQWTSGQGATATDASPDSVRAGQTYAQAAPMPMPGLRPGPPIPAEPLRQGSEALGRGLSGLRLEPGETFSDYMNRPVINIKRALGLDKAKTKTDADVRVTGQKKEPKCPCLVGPYIIIKPQCKPNCGPTAQTHHIVPDKSLGLGNRAAREAGDRIPTPSGSAPFPSFDNGPSICLQGNAKTEGTEHNEAHSNDVEVARRGANSATPGTLPIVMIQDLSVSAAIRARPDCAQQIRGAVEDGFKGVDPNALGRTTTQPPKPGSPVHDLLTPKPRITD